MHRQRGSFSLVADGVTGSDIVRHAVELAFVGVSSVHADHLVIGERVGQEQMGRVIGEPRQLLG